MKRIFSILLISIVMIQCFSKMAIVSYYYINMDYIANQLCVNKKNPNMQCKGKCYLTKKLKAQKQVESKMASELNNLQDFILFYSNAEIFIPTFSTQSTHISHKFSYNEVFIKDNFHCIFQPPKLA